jgi:hypothetical protein
MIVSCAQIQNRFVHVVVKCLLCILKNDSVAQLVEQLTLNQWVESSNLSGVTKA